MPTQRSQLGRELELSPDVFGGTLTTGSNAPLPAVPGQKFLLYSIYVVPNAPGATVDTVLFLINGGASGTPILRAEIDGDGNDFRIHFPVPLLVDDVFATRIAGTASLFLSVFAKRIIMGV